MGRRLWVVGAGACRCKGLCGERLCGAGRQEMVGGGGGGCQWPGGGREVRGRRLQGRMRIKAGGRSLRLHSLGH